MVTYITLATWCSLSFSHRFQ